MSEQTPRPATGYTVHRTGPDYKFTIDAATGLRTQGEYPDALLGQNVRDVTALYPRIKINRNEKGGSDEFAKAQDRLRSHIKDLTGDSRGSFPGLYVSDEDVAFLNKFKWAADDKWGKGWKGAKGATPITHEEVTPRWLQVPEWLKPEYKRKNPAVLDKEGRPIMGYRIGYLNAGQFESPVLFCSDGLLRMRIKTPKEARVVGKFGGEKKPRDVKGIEGKFDGRRFAGFCPLPLPKYLYPVRRRGTMSGVSYNHTQSKTLERELRDLSGLKFT